MQPDPNPWSSRPMPWRQLIEHKLSHIDQWPMYQKICLIYGLFLSSWGCYLAYLLWLINQHSPFVDQGHALKILPLYGLILALAVGLLWATHALRRVQRIQQGMAFFSLLFYGFCQVFAGYQVGLFTLPVGVVISSLPMFIFAFMPADAAYRATTVAMLGLATVYLLLMLNHLPSAPLFLPSFWVDPAARRLMYASQLFFALPHLVGVLGIYDVSSRLRRRRELEVLRLSQLDGLTGLSTRHSLLRHMENMLADPMRLPISLVMLDVDHFKRINDHYGHMAGDDVLRQVAEILRQNARMADQLGRYGGEEFVWVLPNTPLSVAVQVAERHCQALAQTPVQLITGETLNMTASYGVCSTDQDLDSCDEMLMTADRAMYEAKAKGRNCVQVATRLAHPIARRGPMIR